MRLRGVENKLSNPHGNNNNNKNNNKNNNNKKNRGKKNTASYPTDSGRWVADVLMRHCHKQVLNQEVIECTLPRQIMSNAKLRAGHSLEFEHSES